MRLLVSFITVSLFVLFLATVGFYFTREYFLYRGVQNFKKSVLVLQRTGNAVAACTQKNTDLLGVVNDTVQDTTQIRFTSSTDYVLEIICSGFRFDPITLETHELDAYVTKVAGTSGIVMGAERTGVELAVFQDLQDEINTMFGTNWKFIEKTRAVVLENNRFVVLQPGESLGENPISSCEGFGYQCCQSDSEVGVGEVLPGTTSCEQSCLTDWYHRSITDQNHP